MSDSKADQVRRFREAAVEGKAPWQQRLQAKTIAETLPSRDSQPCRRCPDLLAKIATLEAELARVTKLRHETLPVTKPSNVTKPVTRDETQPAVTKPGRPPKHSSPADRARAYRERKRSMSPPA